MAEPFDWRVPPAFNFARDVVDALAGEARTALVAVDAAGARRDYGFAEVAERSRRAAGALRAAGVRRGDRVLVVLPKAPAWIDAMLALCRLGAVAVPCAEQLRAKDLAFRARHAEAAFAIGGAGDHAELDAVLAELPALHGLLMGGEAPGWTALDPLAAAAEPEAGVETRSDEPAYIVYTSGTTSEPKGVVHAHAYAYAKRMQARLWLGAAPGDVVWCTAATGWAKSLWNVLLGPWSCGAATVLDARGFAPAERLAAVRELGVTILCQAPTEYRLEAKLPDLDGHGPFPRLRACVSAGEPLNPEVLARWRDAFGLVILDGYGQTENSLLVANLPGSAVRPGSMGKPTPGHDVDVIDAAGNRCAPDEVGDVGLLGDPPTLFRGYHRAPEATAATRRGAWYLTGDRARRDADGYLWFVGRADDVISSGGYRIGPFEVESALLEHPAVLESAVVGSPDADRGNVVKAFVVLRPGFAPSDALVAELQAHCRRVTAPYKYPRRVAFVDALPKTVSGKIRRVDLRAAELRERGATSASGWE